MTMYLLNKIKYNYLSKQISISYAFSPVVPYNDKDSFWVYCLSTIMYFN